MFPPLTLFFSPRAQSLEEVPRGLQGQAEGLTSCCVLPAAGQGSGWEVEQGGVRVSWADLGTWRGHSSVGVWPA